MDRGSGKSPRVLIVEDSAMFRELLRAHLHARFPQVEVLQAGSVADGYAVAMDTRPDVIVIDIGLPDGNGLDLVARLSQELPGAALAVCTMHDLPEYRREARRRGAAAFFGKSAIAWADVEAFVTGALGRNAESEVPEMDPKGEPETTGDWTGPM